MAKYGNKHRLSSRRKSYTWGQRRSEDVVASAPDTERDRRHPRKKDNTDKDNDKKPKGSGMGRLITK